MPQTKNNRIAFFKAISVMVGYIIGVGMFGLPFVVAKGGVFPFIALMMFFGAVQYFQHLTYGNMIVATEGFHRLPGYAGVYLGPWGKQIIFLAKILGNYGALIAYIIIIGVFLEQLLGPVLGGSSFVYSTAIFAICAALVYFGIGAIARAELLMSGLLLAVVCFIVAKGWGAVDSANFFAYDWRYLILPYGATLMALDGNGSMPIVAKVLNKDKVAIKKAIRVGTILPIAITVVFTLVIVGISGSGTTPDALVGVRQVLDDGVIFFSLIFGVLTMATSILLVSEAIKETLWWDFKVPRNAAWAIAVIVPYFFFALGLRNLTEVISFAGGVAGGLSAVMLLTIFLKMKKMPGKTPLFKYIPTNGLVYFIIAVFFSGITYELIQFMK